jgi:hypothetical protein
MTIQELLATLKATLTQTGIVLYPGADQQLIKHFEQEMNLVLPADFKTFYAFCNGFESGEEWFRMIPLEEILEHKSEYQPRQFYVAEYLIYCDMWEVDLTDGALGTYQIHNGYVPLTDSLAVFMERFLQGGLFSDTGLYNWR